MAAIDVDQVVTEVAAQALPVALIGVAVLLVFVAIKAFRWLQSTMELDGSMFNSDGEYDDNRAADWEEDGGGSIIHNDDGTVDKWYAATDRWERQ